MLAPLDKKSAAQPKSGSGKVMWRQLLDAEAAACATVLRRWAMAAEVRTSFFTGPCLVLPWPS